MKVGLVRHFAVDYECPHRWQLMTPEQFVNWVNEYNKAEVIPKKCELNSTVWDKCYSSDLPRAIKTAQALFDGEIVEAKMLREVVIYPPTTKNVKLPLALWLAMGRIAWILSHESQMETKKDFEQRLSGIVEEMILKERGNILLVSHGFLMIFLRKELVKLGFNGPNFKVPCPGKLYIFEK